MADVTITGTVSHHFSKGIRVQEAGEYGNRYTVWTDLRTPIGTPVTVTGKLGAKTSERDGKHYIDLSVNFPTITPQTGAQGQPAQGGGYQAAGVDQWATSDPEMPF